MQTVDYRIAIACPDHALYDLVQNGYAIDLNPQSENDNNLNLKVEIFVLSSQFINSFHWYKKHIKYQQCYLVFNNDHERIESVDFNKISPDQVIRLDQLSADFMQSHLELLDQKKQDEIMLKMSDELRSQEVQTQKSLQEQILAEQQELINRRQKILESNRRTESLRKILYTITEENDVTRIETLLNELLPQSTAATWIKIIPAGLQEKFETDISQQLPNKFEKYNCGDYFAYFFKGDKKSFRTADTELFQKVTDALHFNLLKSESLSTQQKLEKIVSTAFNSTIYPLLIVDKNYSVIEANKAFYRYPKTGKKCYEIMFNQSSPCANCDFGNEFTITSSNESETHYYNVKSNRLLDYDEKNNHWVHFYSDITEEKLLEQRLSQTAKMKELGLISSSIAHELNNPLGGILSYLQILQMELSKDHALQTDLSDMIKAANRMKVIIENLLIFSRKPSSYEKESTLLKDFINETIKVLDLQFKIENIKVVVSLDQVEQKINLARSAMRDSLHLIFNFFIESLRRARLSKGHYPGLIEVKFSQDQINFYLDVQANVGPLNSDQKTKNIYFLTIHKSLIDQGFQVELTEPNSSWVLFRIAIPKQD